MKNNLVKIILKQAHIPSAFCSSIPISQGATHTNKAPHNCLAKCTLRVEALLSLVRNVRSWSHLYKQAPCKPYGGEASG